MLHYSAHPRYSVLQAACRPLRDTLLASAYLACFALANHPCGMRCAAQGQEPKAMLRKILPLHFVQ